MKKKMYLIIFTSLLLLAGCKKARIEKKLDGTWNVTSLVQAGTQILDTYPNTKLEISSIEDGSGNIRLLLEDSYGTLYIHAGTFVLNDDYAKMDVTMQTNDPGVTWLWYMDMEVDKSNLTLNGTNKYSDESQSFVINIQATK